MRCCQCQRNCRPARSSANTAAPDRCPRRREKREKEAPQAETIQPVRQPAASPVVERETPRAAAAGETEEPPVLLAEKTEECLPEDIAPEPAPQARAGAHRRSRRSSRSENRKWRRPGRQRHSRSFRQRTPPPAEAGDLSCRQPLPRFRPQSSASGTSQRRRWSRRPSRNRRAWSLT